MTGFNTPGTIGRYDFTVPENQRWSIYRSTNVNGLNPDDFEATQVRNSLISFSFADIVVNTGLV